ncbi:uncharacterized protein LOC121387996 isoform X2 [Gigantopelta aegis]|uniref:uncharacterized protein LOC121387996 isoform X2 n=1 Tax=Gigantopelta aegis TaxID=1735272 RepID=UPI001B88E566|nr:uncharacterized protein LOC121387996 isoform X2 [Gigantopelta aegis]
MPSDADHQVDIKIFSETKCNIIKQDIMSMSNNEFQEFFNDQVFGTSLAEAACNHGNSINNQDSSVGTDHQISSNASNVANMSGINGTDESSSLNMQRSTDSYFITVSSPDQVSAMQSLFPSTQSSSSHGATDMLLASASTQRNTLMDNVSTLSNTQCISSNIQTADNVADALTTQTVSMMENNARNGCPQQPANQNNQMNSQQIVMDNSGGNTNVKTMVSADSLNLQQNVNSQNVVRNHGELNSPNVAVAAVGSSNVQDVAKGILNAQNLLSGNVISIPLQSPSGANRISINTCSENQGIGMLDHTQVKAPIFVNIHNMNASQTVTAHGHVDSSPNGSQGMNPSVSVGSHDTSPANIGLAVDRSLPNVFLIQGTANSPKMLIVNAGKNNLGQIPCTFASPAQLNIKDVLSLDTGSQVNVGEPNIALNNEQNLFLHKLLMEARGSLNIVCSKENSQPVNSPHETVSAPSQCMDLGSRENVNLINMLSNNIGILNSVSVPVNSLPKNTSGAEGVGVQAQHMDLGSQDNLNLTQLLSNNHGNLNSQSSTMNTPKNPGQGDGGGGTHLHCMDLGNHENISLSNLLSNNNGNMNSPQVQERMQAGENPSQGGDVPQNVGGMQQRMDLGSQDNLNLSSLLAVDNKGNLNSESIQVIAQSARPPEQILTPTKDEVKSPVMMTNTNTDMTQQGSNQMTAHKQVGEHGMESRSPTASHVMINNQGQLVSENMEVCQQGNMSVQHVLNQAGQNVANQNVGNQSMAGENMSGQSMAGQNISGQNMAGQNTDGQQLESRMEISIQENYSANQANGKNVSQASTNSATSGTVNTTVGLPLDLHNICLDTFQNVPLNMGNLNQQAVFSTATSSSLNVQLKSPTSAGANQHPMSTTSVFSTQTNNFNSISISETTDNAITQLNNLGAESQLSEPSLKLSQPCTLNVSSQGSMLRRMLTGDCDDASLSPSSPISNPENQLESPRDLSSPNNFFQDMTTQSTLINNAEKLHLSSDAYVKDETSDGFNLMMTPFQTEDNTNVPNKIHKGCRDDDAHSSRSDPICVDKLFDANGASSTTSYEFTKFGSDIPGVFKFGLSSKASTVSTSCTNTRAVPSIVMNMSQGGESLKSVVPPPAKPAGHSKKVKDPSLSSHFPNKSHGYELQIVSQPEEQHRARYLTEGSRGAVKDRSQQNYPIVKLHGHNEAVKLQVFVGCETGRMKPHGFYQACKVAGKNSTPCIEKEIDGTMVIELDINTSSDMTASVDCVGILKLRNADVEKRIGVTKARAKKKNSTRARLVFRTTFQKSDGHYITLQAASTPILCTQPIGQPEILRVSLLEATVDGGQSMFIIGKNFLKNTQVFFQEVVMENGTILWEKEASIEQEFFQQTHLICTVPEYHNASVDKPVDMQIIVKCRGKLSDPHEFMYKPYLRNLG